MKKLILTLFAVLAFSGWASAMKVASESAWCWFADPRALHFETPDGRINCTYLGYIDTHGNVRAMQYDFNKEEQTEVLVRSYFQPDDHNNPTFLALPDGRIMIFYSRHTDEPCFYYRISQQPGDITTLGEEKVLKTENNTTYPSPFILSSDPHHIYLCWRGINWHPTIARLSMPDASDNVSFVGGPYQIVQSTGARPYAKYASNGKDKIYVAYTTGHPDNEDPNYLYFNEISVPDLALSDIEGKRLSNIADGPYNVNKTDEFVAENADMVVDASPYRDWLSQVVIDKKGNPVIAMTRISKDKRSHNYYLATRKDGKWQKKLVAHGGGHFHQSPDIEHCYSGGMAINPDNVNEVYCSVPVDGANGRKYEIVKYTLDGNGEIKATSAVTSNSTLNNSRPFVIAGTGESALKMGWLNGDYYDWIVSAQRPKGYCTDVIVDFNGFDSLPYGTHKLGREYTGMPEKFDLNSDFLFTQKIKPDTASYGGMLLQIPFGPAYWLDATTMKPEIRYKKKAYKSSNMLATADEWARQPRGTNGKWYAPVKMTEFELTMEYANGVLSTFINGLLDQKVRLAPSRAVVDVFQINQPDKKLSPYTGMTRKHWVEAGEKILAGAFGQLNSIDGQMYFQRQLDKTYPRNEGGITVAKLEGLARTFFLAAPLLMENPDLELNGIKVAEYYRKHILGLVDPNSPDYQPQKPNGPSQTLLELGSIALCLKICQPVVWDTFSKEEKDALATLMLNYGQGPTIDSNWRFFNVFNMSFCKDQGYEVNDEYLRFNLDKLLERYRGEGWYNDAPAYDYYSMWAFQSYGPLWAHLWGKHYPEAADKFFANQADMVDNYPYMFSRDGKMNMWGRSLPYRFACVTPLPLVEYGDEHLAKAESSTNYGWLRRIASSTLLQFMQNPNFLDEDGIPVMGYYGKFAPCVQIYSCRGSVYWLSKAFFALLLPEDSKFWSAVENNGPWEKEMQAGKVYNKFQPATNLMITDYPNVGGAEMRSWCKETVASDWQKFRSSENYNKLAYHTEFPWMADGKDGEVSMNYATLNDNGDWEVLRLYDFQSFDAGQYRRNAELETNRDVKYQLTDITLPDGVLRVDKVKLPKQTKVRLGSYSLGGDALSNSVRNDAYGHTAITVSNGEYSLAVVPVSGWDSASAAFPYGLHPVSDQCAVVISEAAPVDEQVFVTLHLWKKGDKPFSSAELSKVKSVDVNADKTEVKVTMADGSVHNVIF
ncbi:MAG: DUF2264 domain-containing protein [Clostridium sp.]|nr:DUF2264 domain-containing protein [Clostridium sp.]